MSYTIEYETGSSFDGWDIALDLLCGLTVRVTCENGEQAEGVLKNEGEMKYRVGDLVADCWNILHVLVL